MISGECVTEGLRKDLMNHRKQLTDITLERNTFVESAKNLREIVKQLENEKRDMKTNLEKNFSQTKQLEESLNRMSQQNDELAKRLKDSQIECTKNLTCLSYTKEENEKLKTTTSEKDFIEKELRSR